MFWFNPFFASSIARRSETSRGRSDCGSEVEAVEVFSDLRIVVFSVVEKQQQNVDLPVPRAGEVVRRIDEAHRLVYNVDGDDLIILQA